MSTVNTQAAPDGDAKSIARVDFASLKPENFYTTYRAKSQPCIITGAFEGVEDWTLELIENRLGTDEHGVRIYGKDYREKPKREWKKYSEVKPFTPQAYMQLLRDRTAHEHSMYMAQIPFGETPLAAMIRDRIVGLENRCDMIPIVPQMDLNLWLGPGGHTEPLHFDTGDGTLMQLHGSKRVALFPPSQTKNLYPFAFFREIPPWFSQVDTDKKDESVFPNFSEAVKHRIDVTIEQGEILFIPVNWWHEVTALGSDYVCSVNRFWKVKPFRRNFSHRRSSVFWLMNKLPWKLVLGFDTMMRKVLGRPA